MSFAAYQYQSDDGNTYQVVLPSDFAEALDYNPATGSEQYLPAYISPRYATYQSIPGLLWAPAVVPYPFGGNYPPNQLAVGANVYSLKSTNGEQRGSLANQQVITIAGPQGPPGSQGATGPAGPAGPQGPSADIITVTGSITPSQVANLNSTPYVLVPAQGTNYVIVPVSIYLDNGTSGTAYTGAANINIAWGTNIISSFANGVIGVSPKASVIFSAFSGSFHGNAANLALELFTSGVPTGGTLGLNWSLDYRVVTY